MGPWEEGRTWLRLEEKNAGRDRRKSNRDLTVCLGRGGGREGREDWLSGGDGLRARDMQGTPWASVPTAKMLGRLLC
jgi:hypothetical protein